MTTPARHLAAAAAALCTPLLASPAAAAPGDLDTSFDPGAGANGGVYATALQPDGGVLIGGFFTEVDGTARNRIARLNTGGTLHTFFDPGAGADGAVNSGALQADGKVLIGGDFTEVDGVARNRIARLNANGTLDVSFDPGAGPDGTVYSTALQADGKILIAGGFSEVGGLARNYIARLDADGTLDTAFDPGIGANDFVFATALQADGKVLIGGRFTEVGGTARIRVARLNADGTLDTSFDLGAGADDEIVSMALQADGKVLVGGAFTEVGGTARNRIARLNADGTLDTGFDPGAGADDFVGSTALQADGKVLVGGEFAEMDGTARNGIARLENDAATGSLTVPNLTQVQWIRGGAAPEATRVTFETSIDAGKTYLPLGAGTRIPGGWGLGGVSIPAQCLVRARAFTAGGIYNSSSGIVEETVVVELVSPPSVSILGRKNRTTFRGRLAIRGTASDPDGDLVSVLFRDTRSRGRRWRPARGTSAWRAVAVLRPGRNVIRVQAFDARNAASAIERVRVRRNSRR